MDNEVIGNINFLDTKFPIDLKRSLDETNYNKEITPLVNRFVALFKEKKLTYNECYIVLEIVYKLLQYKSQKVNL